MTDRCKRGLVQDITARASATAAFKPVVRLQWANQHGTLNLLAQAEIIGHMSLERNVSSNLLTAMDAITAYGRILQRKAPSVCFKVQGIHRRT